MTYRLKARLVVPCGGRTWTKEIDLLFPPFPGLGIRIAPYDMLNVESVVIGDYGFDVTCICSVEGGTGYEAETFRSFGFEQSSYP